MAISPLDYNIIYDLNNYSFLGESNIRNLKEIRLKCKQEIEHYKYSLSPTVAKSNKNISEEYYEKQKAVAQRMIGVWTDRLRKTENLCRELDKKELEKEKGEHTYDESLFRYIINSLGEVSSKDLITVLKKDRNRVRDSKEIKLKRERKDLIDMLVGERLKPDGYLSLKEKHEFNKNEDARIEANKKMFESIIKWLDEDYSLRYSSSAGTTYYMDSKTKIINSQRNIDDYSKEKTNEYMLSIKEELDKCDGLLGIYLPQSDRKKIQKYRELTIERAKIKNLINDIDKLIRGMNPEYTRTIKKLKEVKGKLSDKLDNIDTKGFNKYSELKDYVSNLYEQNKSKVEEKKEQNRDIEKLTNKTKTNNENDLNSEAARHNKEWFDKEVIAEIERIYGKQLEMINTNSARYHEVRAQAIENIRKSKNNLNTELQNYFVKYLEHELVGFILANYKPNGKNKEVDVDFIMRDATMSAEERYIRDMVEAGKLPKSTTPENLTQKDYENIKKHISRYADDDLDKKIKDMREKINKVTSTDYFTVYKAEDIQEMLRNITREQRETFEIAKSRLNR